MTDLVARLREAIDETERIAQAAGTKWELDEYLNREDGPQLLLMFDGRGMAGIGWQADDALRPPQARHIARHDPAAVLRRCAADRKLLEEYDKARTWAQMYRTDPEVNEHQALLRVLRILAEAYGIEA